MKKELVKIIKSPKSKSQLVLHDEVFENNEIKSGTLTDDMNNQFKIVDYIPRFVDHNSQTIESFSYKWTKFLSAGLSKQEQNKQIFLQHYGWNHDQFQNFLSTRNKILDVGCGIGYISNWMATESNANVFGVDISSSVDKAFESFSNKKNINFIQADMGKLPFEEKFFDFIVVKESIHHTPEPRNNFSKLVKLLDKNGVIVVYVYKKKGPIREFCDDFIRSKTTKMNVDECYDFAVAMTEFGRSLREKKIDIEVPMDIPLLNIKSGTYDLQRFVYWNFFKCFWDDEGNRDYSIAVNFDWYHPEDAFRYTPDEIKEWFAEENVRIDNFEILDAGIAVRGTKIG